MKISIITVCYNSGNTIADTLESVKNQTYAHVEHIIVDGASTDNTLEIVQQFSHVAKIISEPDNGIYDAMNKGIALATGDLIGILNSDDILYDHSTLEHIANRFAQDPTIDAVFGDITYFNSRDKLKSVRYWKSCAYNDKYFEQGHFPPHPSLYVKKVVYHAIGAYRTDYKICADMEFILRLLKVNKAKSAYMPEPIVKMRVGGVSTTGLQSYITITVEGRKAWLDNGLKYPAKLFLLRPFIKFKQLLFRK